MTHPNLFEFSLLTSRLKCLPVTRSRRQSLQPNLLVFSPRSYAVSSLDHLNFLVSGLTFSCVVGQASVASCRRWVLVVLGIDKSMGRGGGPLQILLRVIVLDSVKVF